MIRIITAGGRDFNDYDLLVSEFAKLLSNLKYEGYNIHRSTIEIISGGAKGADKLGEKLAKNHNIKLSVFPAEWNNLEDETCEIRYNKYGEPYNVLAGFNRNIRMAKYAKDSDLGILLAFWDGKSGGTKHMIETANKANLRVHIVKYHKCLFI